VQVFQVPLSGFRFCSLGGAGEELIWLPVQVPMVLGSGAGFDGASDEAQAKVQIDSWVGG